MKTVRSRSIKDYFTASNAKARLLDHLLPAFVIHNQRINPFTIACGIILLCVIGGLSSRLLMALAIALSSFLYLIYWQTKAQAKSLSIKRIVPKFKYHEFETIEVQYTITNHSSVTTHSLVLVDNFEPSYEQEVHVDVPSSVKARSRRTFSYRRQANSGMGMKCIGPLTLKLSDIFGFFEFEILDDSLIEVEVLPKIEDLPDVDVKGSDTSGFYGQYLTEKPGSSVNFVGVREYRPGDSLRHISWKLSARSNELYVKEFENLTNADISVYLNLDPALHIGTRKNSTWEMAKDVALSLASQQSALSNTVTFFSQNIMVDPFVGDSGLHEMAKHLIQLDPMLNQLEELPIWMSQTTSSLELIQKFQPFQRQGGNAFLITPYLKSETLSLTKAVQSLMVQGVKVWCILIDTESFFRHHQSKLNYQTKIISPPLDGIENQIYQLELQGVEVIQLSANQSFQKSFLKSRKRVS